MDLYNYTCKFRLHYVHGISLHDSILCQHISFGLDQHLIERHHLVIIVITRGRHLKRGPGRKIHNYIGRRILSPSYIIYIYIDFRLDLSKVNIHYKT